MLAGSLSQEDEDAVLAELEALAQVRPRPSPRPARRVGFTRLVFQRRRVTLCCPSACLLRETSSFQRFLETSFLLTPRPQRRNQVYTHTHTHTHTHTVSSNPFSKPLHLSLSQRGNVPGRSPSGRCSPPKEPWTDLHESLLHLENPPSRALSPRLLVSRRRTRLCGFPLVSLHLLHLLPPQLPRHSSPSSTESQRS